MKEAVKRCVFCISSNNDVLRQEAGNTVTAARSLTIYVLGSIEN